MTIEPQVFNLADSDLLLSDTVITPMQDGAVSWGLTASGNVTVGASYTSLVIATAPDLADAIKIDAVYTDALAPGDTVTLSIGCVLLRAGTGVTDWPHIIPHELAEALAELDRRRYGASDADRWGVIRDWLVKNGVEAPVGRWPTAPEIRN